LSPQNSALRDVNVEIDRELVRSIARGSSDALGRLYDRHAGVVYAMARRILVQQEDAEEVVQDVFSQVWRDAARYEAGRASVAGWIVMLARARAIDRLRARRARPDSNTAGAPDAGPVLADAGPSPEEITASADDAKRVRGALETLPENQRALVDLAYFEGLTHSEIAERTSVPLGTVKTRLRTAMASLREALSS
jgi:RNA polymerase sigma-70 factor, ECF subfamily